MALPSTLVWECRTGGSDSNGGGFDPNVASPGTDYTQQNAAQVAYTDLVIGATNTQLTSSANSFTSAHVGNTINITGGTGFTTGWYNIRSVSVNTATMDRTVGTANSTNGTGNLGGALLSPSIAAGNAVTSNIIFVKNGTFTISTNTTNAANGRVTMPGGTNTAMAMLVGYNTTRTIDNSDSTIPILNVTTPVTWAVILGNQYIRIRNIKVQFNYSGGNSNFGIYMDSNFGIVENSVITNPGSAQVVQAFYEDGSQNTVINCYVSGVQQGFIIQNFSTAVVCTATACTTEGFLGGVCTFLYCIAFANAGYGFNGANNSSVRFYHCTSYGNTGANGQGFLLNNNDTCINCVATGNAKFGFNANGTAWETLRMLNCAGFNNTSGNTDSNISTHANFGFITLSADPFTNAAGGDFSLNSTAGGGAALRGSGFPSSYPNTITNTFPSVGASQPSTSSGGGLLFNPNMTGNCNN